MHNNEFVKNNNEYQESKTILEKFVTTTEVIYNYFRLLNFANSQNIFKKEYHV